MTSVWTQKFSVKIYEVDFKNRMKLSCFFNYMQEAAENHANNMGVGRNNLDKLDFFWILSRAKINILNYPKVGDNISVHTWPKDKNKYFVMRDFLILDSNENIIAKATSNWLIVDKNNLNMKKTDTLPIELIMNSKKQALNEKLNKIQHENKIVSTTQRIAKYSDVDINNHVNNAKYIDWIIDSIDLNIVKNTNIKSFQINYLYEIKLGDLITINHHTSTENSKVYFIDGINESKEKKSFQCKIEFN